MEVELNRPFLSYGSRQPEAFRDRVMFYNGGDAQLYAFDPASVAVDTTPTQLETLDMLRNGGIRDTTMIVTDRVWVVDTTAGAARSFDVDTAEFGPMITFEDEGWNVSGAIVLEANNEVVLVATRGDAPTVLVPAADGSIRSHVVDTEYSGTSGMPAVVGQKIVLLWAGPAESGEVSVVDLVTGQQSGPVSLGDDGYRFNLVHADATSAWYVSHEKPRVLVQFDAASASVAATYALPEELESSAGGMKWIGDDPYVIVRNDDDNSAEVVFLREG